MFARRTVAAAVGAGALLAAVPTTAHADRPGPQLERTYDRAYAKASRAGRIAGQADFAAVAEAHGVSPQQVCLAWMLAKSPTVIPIPGSSRPETIRSSAAATHLGLTPEQLQQLDAA